MDVNPIENVIPFDLQEVKKPEELLTASISGSPYDFAQMFPMEKWTQRRLAKKKLMQHTARSYHSQYAA